MRWVVCLLPRMLRSKSSMAQTRDDKPAKLEESSIELLEKRKATPRSSKDKDASSQIRDVSPLRKKLRLPYVVIKYSSKEVSFAKKTQLGATPSSSAMVKHLVGVNNKNIGVMRNVRDILLKSPANKLKTCDMLYKEACSQPNHQSKDDG